LNKPKKPKLKKQSKTGRQKKPAIYTLQNSL